MRRRLEAGEIIQEGDYYYHLGVQKPYEHNIGKQIASGTMSFRPDPPDLVIKAANSLGDQVNHPRFTGDRHFDYMIECCRDILATKGADYGAHDDRLAEFRATAADMGITMRQTLGVYLNKHLRALKKWTRGEELFGEPIEDKLLDVIVYCLLGYKLSEEEKFNETK